MVGAVGNFPPGAVDGRTTVDNSLTRKGRSSEKPGMRARGRPPYLPRTPALVAPMRDAPDRSPPTTRAEGRVPTTVAYCSRTSR